MSFLRICTYSFKLALLAGHSESVSCIHSFIPPPPLPGQAFRSSRSFLQDAKEQLAALTELNIGDDFATITNGDAPGDQGGPHGAGDGPTKKAPDAIDYADETEMMDDPEAPEPAATTP